MNIVRRTERGWPGHYCCSDKCLFRRNTLLECDDIRIVVSTVGLMKIEDKYEEVGFNRYYETMAFHAERVMDRYWDADVTREVSFDSPRSISKVDADDRANDMHEMVVEEIMRGLENMKQLSNKVLVAMFYHSDVDDYYELRDELLRRLEELDNLKCCGNCKFSATRGYLACHY